MFYYKSLRLLSCFAIGVSIITMASKTKTSNRSEAVTAVANLYLKEVQRFDSSLAAYPKYFPDSAYTVRKRKFEELTEQFKRMIGMFAYFHSKLAYETFLLTARLETRDFGPPLPDNWLWIGPFGIDPDSLMKTRTKDDSTFEKAFIERAVGNMRKTIQQSGYSKEVREMNEEQIFDALRLQMVRISTLELSNGDLVIEEAGMPSLRGAFTSWAGRGRSPAARCRRGRRAAPSGCRACRRRRGTTPPPNNRCARRGWSARRAAGRGRPSREARAG